MSELNGPCVPIIRVVLLDVVIQLFVQPLPFVAVTHLAHQKMRF